MAIISLILMSVPKVMSLWPLPHIQDVISFGDSLSDKGNFYQLSNHTIPNNATYKSGRFSDGFVWTEELAFKLNANQINYAYGFATSDQAIFEPIQNHTVPGCMQQVEQFLVDLNQNRVQIRNENKTLATLAFTGQDIAHDKLDAQDSVDVQEECLIQLMNSDQVKHVIVVTSFSPELFPIPPQLERGYSKPTKTSTNINATNINATNKAQYYKERAELWSLKLIELQTKFPNAYFYNLDLNATIHTLVKQHPRLIIEEPSVKTSLSNPNRSYLNFPINNRLFWDYYNFASKGHQFIANQAAKLLEFKY